MPVANDLTGINMKESTALFSTQMTEDDRKMFKEIAAHRGVSMAGLLRSWIRASHKSTNIGKTK
jgi:hypothetical protein